MATGAAREERSQLEGGVECSALGWEGQDSNILFVPTCSCPRCAPGGLEVRAADAGWARVSERQQRLRVAVVALGPAGRAVLG